MYNGTYIFNLFVGGGWNFRRFRKWVIPASTHTIPKGELLITVVCFLVNCVKATGVLFPFCLFRIAVIVSWLTYWALWAGPIPEVKIAYVYKTTDFKRTCGLLCNAGGLCNYNYTWTIKSINYGVSLNNTKRLLEKDMTLHWWNMVANDIIVMHWSSE